MSHLHPLLTTSAYLTFARQYLALFVIIFLLPLILVGIARFSPLPPMALRRQRRWVILGAFAAAFLLPIAPDFVAQLMLALPVVLSYELSVWAVAWAHSRRERRSRALTPPEPPPGPQRLPMAIAVPHRQHARRAQSMEPIREHQRESVIDLREQ